MSDYRRGRIIGRGKTSIVYEAVHILTGNLYALKVFKVTGGVPKDEMSIASKLTHVNVCRVYLPFTDDDGAICIPMDLVRGGTLRQLIQRSGPVSLEKALKILAQILNALEACHQAGIVHRDIKPSNIFVEIDDNGDVLIKIGDFGNARLIGTRTDFKINPFIGTAPYAAPEQGINGAIVDERADLFAATMVFLALLNGEVYDEAPAQLPIPTGLPPAIDRAILTGFAMNAEHRFASAAMFRGALLAPAVPDVPATVIPATVQLIDNYPGASRNPSFERRGTWLLLVAIVLAGLGLGSYWRREVQPSAAAGPPSRSGASPLSDANATGPVLRPKGATRRLTVLDFKNLTGDAALDHYSMGIPEVISVELANLRGLTLVEAAGENQATPQDAGKAASADLVVYGSFQRENRKLILTAHILDVDSNNQVPPVGAVEKADHDLFALQGDLGRQLAAAIQKNLSAADCQDLETLTTGAYSPQAFQNFVDGATYLRHNLPQEALNSFNAVLAEYPNFPGAQYHRAEALEKLNRTDDAIDALKKALARAEPEKPVLWHWDFQRSARHGWINALDTAHMQSQRMRMQNETTTNFQRQIVYAESQDAGTLIHLIDPERKNPVQDQHIDDTHVRFFTANEDYAYSDGKTTVLTSLTIAADGAVTSVHYYGFPNAGGRWDFALPSDIGKDIPIAALIGNSFFVDMPAIHRVDVYDARTGIRRWSDSDLSLESAEVPVNASTTRHGDIIMFKSKDTYRALRLDDKKEAWVVHGIQSAKVSQLVTDKQLIIFEPERRILMVDLESGKVVHEIRMTQFVDNRTTLTGPLPVVAALVNDQVLYVLSQDLQLRAIDLKRGVTLWKSRLPQRFQSILVHESRIYLRTEPDDLIVMDRGNGKILQSWKVLPESVIQLVDDKTVVMTSNNPMVLYAVSSADGKTLWQVDRLALETNVANGLVTSYASLTQMFAVDPASGEFVWQNSGTLPWLHIAGDRLFVLSRDGITEYSSVARPEKVSDRQVLTAIARLYLAKHDLAQATAFAQRAAAIDPDYAPLVLVQSHIDKAEKKNTEAGIELARYAALVGIDGPEGKQAIAELTRDYGLQWETAIDPDIVGDPVLTGDRLVGVGRRSIPTLHLLALDLKNGGIAWRYPADRFVASVAGTFANNPTLWYVAGDGADATKVALYRLDVHGGHRDLIGNWNERSGVVHAWIAFSGNRVLVGTASTNPTARIVDVAVRAIDAGSGQVLWQRDHHIPKATLLELEKPITLFDAENDRLTYTVGSQRLAVVVSTNTMTTPVEAIPAGLSHSIVNDTVAQELDPKTGKVLAKHSILWRPHTFLIDSGRMFAFTPDGHAYAMNK